MKRWVVRGAVCLTALALLIGTGNLAMTNTIDGLPGHATGDAEYVFGFSGGTDSNLVLTFAGGGTATLTTSMGVINAPRNQGWWSLTSGNSDGNDNYIAGNAGGTAWNDFFTFDVAGLTPTVTSATLQAVKAEAHSDTGRAF
jgi:hypothetical protein